MIVSPCAGCVSRYAYDGDWSGRVYCVRKICTYRCLVMRAGALTGFPRLGAIGQGEQAYRQFVTQANMVELTAVWYTIPLQTRVHVDDIDLTMLTERQEVSQ